MAVKGNVKENVDYSKKVGLFEAEVVTFNPNKEELAKLLNTTLEKEPVYEKENDEGDILHFVSVWLKDVKTEALFNLHFTLIDKVRLNKDGDKTQYINQVGMSTWVDEESNLPSWFTHFMSKEQVPIGDKAVRECHNGEAELYDFLRAWLKLDYYKVDTELEVSWERLMKNNVKELRELITSDFAGTVLCLATVRTVDKTGNNGESTTSQYQGVSIKAFLPGHMMKFVNNGSFPKSLEKMWKKYKEAFTSDEYGEKAFFILSPLRDYNDNEDFAATGSAKVVEDGDSSY